MTILEFLFVPSILFMIFVAPAWVVLHYRSRRRAESSISEHELMQLEELLAKLDKMSDRVATLEKILDERSPSWRAQTGTEGGK